MTLLTQTECANEFNVTKQYINNLIRNRKIKSYNQKVDLNEVNEYINGKESYNNIDTTNIIEEARLKSKMIFVGKYKLDKINEDELRNFMIENFYHYFDSFTFKDKFQRLCTIQTYIYHYQYFYETQPINYREIMKNIQNKINYAKKNNKDLLKIIEQIDYIPEAKLDKPYLKQVIQLMTVPLNARLKTKEQQKLYDYKIDKILQQLPF